MAHIVDTVKFLLNNQISLFIICYLLTVTPILGIMIIHSEKKK